MTSWSRRFQDLITMPDGSTIRTIGEAAEYATGLSRKIGNTVAMAARREGLARGSRAWRPVRVHGQD
ncbi:MAG: hypothetical protein K0Q64_1207 [Nitrobacter vulgaris]|jgi:hypothetical protein|nr:hypothetical protein [Nitrobacter vulgaris]